MASKEINVFNTSFLDLLSGELGAILILFVIIPKMDSTVRSEVVNQNEEIESLKKQIEKVDILKQQLNQSLEKVKNSVSVETYAEVQSRLNNLQTNTENLTKTIDDLEQLVKNLQIQLVKSEDERRSLQKRIEQDRKETKEIEEKLRESDKNREELVEQLEQLKSKVNTNTDKENVLNDKIADINKDKVQLEQEIKDLRDKLNQTIDQLKNCTNNKSAEDALTVLQKENTDLQRKNDALKDAIEKLQSGSVSAEEVAKLEMENSALKKRLKAMEEDDDKPSKGSKTGLELDKNIVIMLDVSGSMDDEPEPDKLDQVKAGLKMLIATLNESNKVEIVIFPQGPNEGQDFQPFFGSLRKVDSDTKYIIYNEVSKLYARNCTPTRAVFDYVLNEPAYKDAGTIIFLSDGLPTVRKGTDCPEDNTTALIEHIKDLNGNRRKINTIGVGAAYRDRASVKAEVQFMKKLAKENNGFYIGF